jgi:parallel beta-helix repeat protein
MKNLVTIFAIALFFIFSACSKEVDSYQLQSTTISGITQAHKRIYFTQQGNYIPSSFAYSPGDTFVLKEGINYTYFSMDGIHDITIINEGHVHLLNGFNLANCNHVTISGTGDANDFYGFEISGHTSGDVGIDVNGKSKNITINNVFVHNKTYGFWVKNESNLSCDISFLYPYWYMDSISIHDNKIVNVNQEGMYLGSTDQNNDRPNPCGASNYPTRLSNISVFNNIIDSTYRGGIQLSGADKGVNSIYRNTISRCGYELNSYQGNGIVIGGNAYANIDHNTITNTLCSGIWILGTGVTRVRHNNISNSGYLDGHTAGGMQGISFDVRPSFPFVLSTFRIKSNTIKNHTDKNDIMIYNTMQNVSGKSVSGFNTRSNLIYDNNSGKATVYAQPGIVFSSKPN